MSLTVHVHTNTPHQALRRELTDALADGAVQFPEAERLAQLAGTVPSAAGAREVRRALDKATGTDTKALLIGVLDNFEAGKKADRLLRSVVRDGVVTPAEARTLVSADTRFEAARARLEAALTDSRLTWQGSSREVVATKLGKDLTEDLLWDAFKNVLEAKRIFFDGATGVPSGKPKVSDVADSAIPGRMGALLAEARKEPSDINVVHGPWRLEVDGQAYFAYFHDQSEDGAAVVSDLQGNVLLNRFVLING